VLMRKEGDDVLTVVEDQGQGPSPTRAPRLAAVKSPPKDDDDDEIEIPQLGKPPVKEQEDDPAPRSRRGRKAAAKPVEEEDEPAPAKGKSEVKRASPAIDAELAALDGLFS